MKTPKNTDAIKTLANLSRGYATDAQIQAALDREQELFSTLSIAYESMLKMRSMLLACDVSLTGGTLNQVIQSTAMVLYPPKE